MGAAALLFTPAEIGWLLVEADALMARAGRRAALADPHRHAEVFARLAADPRLCGAAMRAAGLPQHLAASCLVRGDGAPPGRREGALHVAVALGGDPLAEVGAVAFAPTRREALEQLGAPGVRFVASFAPGAACPPPPEGGLWPLAFVCAG